MKINHIGRRRVYCANTIKFKGHHTSSYFARRKILKHLVDNGTISYENDTIKVND